MKTEGVFITDIEWRLVEITDFNKAITQARDFVGMHEECKRAKERGDDDVIYYKQAHEYWADILFELEKLGIKNGWEVTV